MGDDEEHQWPLCHSGVFSFREGNSLCWLSAKGNNTYYITTINVVTIVGHPTIPAMVKQYYIA